MASADRNRRDKTSQGSCGYVQIFDLFWKIERFSKKFFVVKIFASFTYSILRTFRFGRNVILHFVQSSYRLPQSALLPGFQSFPYSFDRLHKCLPTQGKFCWTLRGAPSVRPILFHWGNVSFSLTKPRILRSWNYQFTLDFYPSLNDCSSLPCVYLLPVPSIGKYPASSSL